MRFLFVCGGTAGHINPALAVAGRLQKLKPDSEFLFLGVNGKMEMNLVPKAGFRIIGLNMTFLKRGYDLSSFSHNFDTMKNVLRSRQEARRIIREFKPDAVIGTGGYVCFPVLEAARELRIPTLVHESNAVPGLTTKLLAERVDRIMLGFEESRQYYRHQERICITGTPVRGEFEYISRDEARKELQLSDDEKLVISVWGSLGAQNMNRIMGELIPMMDGRQGFRMIHAAGSLYYHELLEKLQESAPDYKNAGVEVREYIYDMPRLMAAADLILCRAGASTISELCYLGKPVIMVPSPNVTNNHQEKNARILETAGGAEVLLEEEFDAESLLERVNLLLKDERKLESMGKAMRALSVPDAAGEIAAIILNLCS